MADKLGDVLGSLLADVTRARVRADVEALRIAEAYSQDPLLKHMAVPRFRMPEITVDLPVLVEGVDQSSAEASAAWSAAQPTKTELAKAVKAGVAGSEIKLTKAHSDAATEAASKRVEELFAKGDLSLMSPGRVADEVAAEVVSTVKSKLRTDPSPAELQALSSVTKAATISLVNSKLAPSPATEVKFTSEAIKAHGDSGNVVRLRFTISEDSYEMVDRDDGGYFLSPE